MIAEFHEFDDPPEPLRTSLKNVPALWKEQFWMFVPTFPLTLITAPADWSAVAAVNVRSRNCVYQPPPVPGRVIRSPPTFAVQRSSVNAVAGDPARFDPWPCQVNILFDG